MADDRSFMELDSPEGFSALQDRFTFNRRARPPPLLNVPDSVQQRVPLREPKIQRRESKGGLRGIFTRNKTEQAAVPSVVEESPTSAMSKYTITAMQSSYPRSIEVPRTNAIPTPPNPATPARPSTMGSRMNLRAKSEKSVKPAKPSPKSSTKSPPRRPPRTSAAWDPPPLFQAYPQAIKHATLSASTLSADAILRMSNHKRTSSLRDEIAQTGSTPAANSAIAGKRAEKPKSKHRRQLSGSVLKAEWTQKIFVLVTSGYLLQYSGDGSFDRLPEKMLQLTRDSVAFASDVIPGKHWVLQISQAMDSDGTPAADSRSLLSRLAFRGADYRRTATSLLLVLNSAEDMDSWMAVVKREIEALGGKKQVSETGKPRPDDKIMQLKAQPSPRYLVARDADQFSNPASPQLASPGLPPWVEDKPEELQQDSEQTLKPLPTPSLRPSSGSQSMTNSTTSQDGRQLENLRDSNRFSYMSSGQRTLITSQDSTPASSPIRTSIPSFDETPKASVEDSRARPNAAAIDERRRSMQNFKVPVLDLAPDPRSYRHSTYGRPPRSARGQSPGTPNFSIPNPSTKRYSSLERPVAVSPPPLSIVTPLPSSPQDSKRFSVIKGARKSPPRPINPTRPLSPVEDSSSPNSPPKQTPMIIRHRKSTFEILQKARSAEIESPPRSPYLSTLSTETVFLSRLMTPPDPIDSEQDIVQTPERPLARSQPPILPAEEIPSNESTGTLIPTVGGEIERDISPPLPKLANTKANLVRTTSMQISTSTKLASSNGRASAQSMHANSSPPPSTRIWPSPSPTITQTPNSNRPVSTALTAPSRTSNRGAVSPVGRMSNSMVSLAPSLQRVKEQSAVEKTLEYRRSMPLLNMPPPAPPPDCALPPLPPPGFTGVKGPLSKPNVVLRV